MTCGIRCSSVSTLTRLQWTAEKSSFDLRKVGEIYALSQVLGLVLVLTQPPSQ